MRLLPIENFVPFPGNVFTYFYSVKNEFEAGENLCLTFKNRSVGVIVEVIKRVKLDQDVSVQFKVLNSVEINKKNELRRIVPKAIENKVSDEEKERFKNLLISWDYSEFGDASNYYFQEIDKVIDRKRFIELVGGCLNRPYKYPYNIEEKVEMAVENRLNILQLSSCEEQLEAISNLIKNES